MNPYGLSPEMLGELQAERDARTAAASERLADAPPPAAPPGDPVARWVGDKAVPAVKHAFSSPDPIFQVPGRPAPQAPDPNVIDLDEPAPGAAPPAPMPMGPTPEENHQFAAAQAQVAAPQAPPPVAARPLAPAAPRGPDPLRQAQGAYLDTFDAREDAMRRASAAEQDRAVMLGDAAAEQARRRQEDAAIQNLESQAAAEHFDRGMAELERQIDDVRAKKIDPKRLMKDEPAMGFLAVLGGAIGGFAQATTRSGENGFLKQLNTMIDRDIAAQESEKEDETKAVQQKIGLLGQQRAIFQDAEASKLAARALYYQAAQDELQAEAARYGTPVAQANADEAIATVEGEKQKTIAALAEANKKLAAAMAGRSTAQRREVQARYNAVWDTVFKETQNPALAEAEAKRQIGVLYAPQTVGERAPMGPEDASTMGMTTRDRSHMLREKAVAQEEARAELQSLRGWKERASEISSGSTVGDYWSAAPGFVPGVDTAKENKLNREMYNASIARAYDAAMKGAQGSTPTESQKAQLKAFYAEPNDSEAIVKKKIEAGEAFVIESARAKGFVDITPREQRAALGLKPIRK